MNLHEFLTNYTFSSLFGDHPRQGEHLTNKEILKIEQAYYNNRRFIYPDELMEPLNEWLCDPETIGFLGGNF